MYVSWFGFLSLSRWMSVPVFGFIMTHCMSIYVSGSWLFLSFSLIICCSDWLYYHSLYVCMSVPWSVFFSFSYSFNGYSSVRLYCHWLQFYRYFSWSAYPSLFSFSLSVSVYGYIIGKSAYVPWFIFVSLSFYVNVFTTARLYYYSL